MCGCLSCAPYWRPGLQPRHALPLGSDPLVHRPALNPLSHINQGGPQGIITREIAEEKQEIWHWPCNAKYFFLEAEN